MKHYTKETLELYRNGKMSVLGRISCQSHLQKCPECSKLMEELKEDDHLITKLRASLQIYTDTGSPEPAASNKN